MPPLPDEKLTHEERLERRMASIFKTQKIEAAMASRCALLKDHYLGWKDFSGVVHCEPHPDDGYLPLKDWDNE